MKLCVDVFSLMDMWCNKCMDLPLWLPLKNSVNNILQKAWSVPNMDYWDNIYHLNTVLITAIEILNIHPTKPNSNSTQPIFSSAPSVLYSRPSLMNTYCFITTLHLNHTFWMQIWSHIAVPSYGRGELLLSGEAKEEETL